MPQGDEREGDGSGAGRRTWLAAERTYLAWLRTGLGALGVALAVGRVVPALIGGSRTAWVCLGAAYGLLGTFMIVHAFLRSRRVEAALEVDGSVPTDRWAIGVITGASLAVAVATVVIVFVS